MAMMLGLSDLLISGNLAPWESYLSGYPLKSSHKFVLARTWAATEQPRPGAVWTHSLLLDYSTLTVVEDLVQLLSEFSRPSEATLHQYEVPIVFSAEREKTQSATREALSKEPRVPQVLHRLYGIGARHFITMPATEGRSDELLAMALWRQMWPSQRRNFAFFTRSSFDSVDVGTDCSLYFSDELQDIPAHQVSRMPTDAEWLGLAALEHDLPKRGPTKLRRFLGRYAFDAKYPRDAVPALAALYQQRKFETGVALDFDTFLRDPSAFRRLKADILFESARKPDNFSLFSEIAQRLSDEPELRTVSALDDALRSSSTLDSVGGPLLEALSSSLPGSMGAQIFDAIARHVSPPVLAQQISRIPPSRLLCARPDVVRSIAFWDGEETEHWQLASDALVVGASASDILQGLQAGLTPEIAALLLEHEPGAILGIYEASLSSRRRWKIIEHLALHGDLLHELINAKTTISLDALESTIGVLMRFGQPLMVDARDLLNLLARADARPTFAQPFVATLGLETSLRDDKTEALTLFELCFDGAYESAARYDLPEQCGKALRQFSVKQKKGSYWNDELLLDLAIRRYQLKTGFLSRFFAATSNPKTLTELCRRLRSAHGAAFVRNLCLSLSGSEMWLQMPISRVREAVNRSLPFSFPRVDGPRDD